MTSKLAHVVTTALRDRKIDYPEAARVTAAATWDAPKARLSRADVAALKRVAALPDTVFVDRKQPSYVKAQRDEIREYAQGIRALQKLRLQVRSKVPGISVGLKDHFAVVDMNELGYTHKLILEVKMPAKRAASDGTLAFRYGPVTVSVEVKKGQTRESVMGRIAARLSRLQPGVRTGESTETSREFLLHGVTR